MTTLKHNKRERTTLFEKEIIENNGAYTKFVDSKKMSPSEFKRFQQKLKENNKKNERKLKLVFGSIMFLMVSLLIYFLFYFSY